MVQVAFFLRYRQQLRRTRPELVPRMEEAFVKAVRDAGGKITGERRMISASFDDESLGFWLDMLILIETVTKTLETAMPDLFGYSLVLGQDLVKTAETPQALEPLCRFLAGGNQGGVFLDMFAAERLFPYITVEVPEKWLQDRGQRAEAAGKNRAGSFFRFGEVKVFVPTAKSRYPQWEAVLQTLRQGPQYSALIIGPCFEKKREDIYQCCASLAGNYPPLFIRFGAGTLNALTDAWSPRIYSQIEAGAETAELDELWEVLFRERLREEISGFIARKARRFFRLLLRFYTAAAREKNAMPILVVENIHLAEDIAAGIFIDTFTEMQKRQDIAILGTCNEQITSEQLIRWERMFPRMFKINTSEVSGFRPPELRGPLPSDLWEIAYAIALLGRYYPPFLFLQLFEEAGKNTVMISRALSFLVSLGVIDTLIDPRPWPENFCEQAEAALGARTGPVREMVRRRLMSWVDEQNLNPCFRLLLILVDLGGMEDIDDQLILRAVTADLENGTTAGLERAQELGMLETLAGVERAVVIRYILETTKALLAGDEEEVHAAFREPPPDCASMPVFKSRILANMSSLHLGLRNTDSALETIKEVILLSQGENNLSLAQSYRMFSLVSLSKQRTREAVDYLGFAADNAERAGNYHEMGVAGYYAAAVQFLTGNVSGAAKLARKAYEQALAASCPEWAERSRFLEGRLAFEIGQYQTALEIFVNLRNVPLGELSARREQLLDAWAYRTRVYFQDPMTAKPVGGGHDADLFEVEAAYLAGNYEKTVELSGSLANPHIEENILFTEQADWRSGFSQCEYLYFSHGEIWDRMVSMYHSLALCHLSAAGGEEAAHDMQRILRDEKMSEMDPWDAVYFYAWYLILEQTGAGQVDMNTALTMAFKRLQRRASRIDDMETRRQFLSQPRWNKGLSLAAKEFKLMI